MPINSDFQTVFVERKKTYGKDEMCFSPRKIYFKILFNSRVEFGALATETQALNLGQVTFEYACLML